MVTYLKCTSLDTEYGIKLRVFRLALLTFQLDETAFPDNLFAEGNVPGEEIL
ncbi:hypothetical protein NC651_002004 [Populus alba x Populus x berolinensis]|nr:hypothetical protein NC651_002004 [Populus alba x Populus x berolinensis]